MALYGRIADLPVTIDAVELRRHEAGRPTKRPRISTEVLLRGEGAVGRGEDVTKDAPDHESLHETDADPTELFPITGTFTIDEFSSRLGDLDLFPHGAPRRDTARQHRRWAFESAGLDLALRRADRSLAEALGRSPDPVRFVASTRLGDPPTIDRIDALLDRRPELEFKLDPTADWDAGLVDALAGTGAVRILDLKDWRDITNRETEADSISGEAYGNVAMNTDPDVELYERVLAAFPDVIVEDPAVTPETRPILGEHADRLAFDTAITGVDSVASLPVSPRWLNVKPSRFGSIESLLATVEHCDREGIAAYGGGTFELTVGRRHVQLLASLFSPDAPNDVAPSAYNLPEVPPSLPASPLAPPSDGRGLDF